MQVLCFFKVSMGDFFRFSFLLFFENYLYEIDPFSFFSPKLSLPLTLSFDPAFSPFFCYFCRLEVFSFRASFSFVLDFLCPLKAKGLDTIVRL